MDCEEFAARYSAMFAGTLDDATQASMAEHARHCRDCGQKWDEQRELGNTIQSVLGAHKLPPNLAEDVSGKLHQEHFGGSFGATVPRSGSSSAISWSAPTMPLLLAALLGGLVGYLLGGPRSQPGLQQQIAVAQMLDGRMAMGRMPEMMLLGLMNDQLAGGSGVLGRGLPQITSTVRTLFFVFLVLWLTRTKIWDAVFPGGVPSGLQAARWAALLAAILGLARCASGIYVTLRIVTAAGGMGRGGSMSQLIEQWSPSLTILDQVWNITFWLTLMIVFFTVANQLSLRWVRRPDLG